MTPREKAAMPAGNPHKADVFMYGTIRKKDDRFAGFLAASSHAEAEQRAKELGLLLYGSPFPKAGQAIGRIKR